MERTGVSGKEMMTVFGGVDYCLAFLRQSIQNLMCFSKTAVKDLSKYFSVFLTLPDSFTFLSFEEEQPAC